MATACDAHPSTHAQFAQVSGGKKPRRQIVVLGKLPTCAAQAILTYAAQSILTYAAQARAS